MAITASMVKELREMTGVGMLDCKKALAETDGDMEKAVEYLREKVLPLQKRRPDVLHQKVFAFHIFQRIRQQALS